MNEISISNLNIAAFLLVRGFTLDRVRQSGPTVLFVFSDLQGIGQQTISEFYKDPAVGVKSYVAALRQCRDMLFEIKRQSQFPGHENETHTQARHESR